MDSSVNTRLLSVQCPSLWHSSAERFLRKTINATYTQTPRVVNVDKNAAIPPAVDKLKADEQLPEMTELRQVKCLNNLSELCAPLPLRA